MAEIFDLEWVCCNKSLLARPERNEWKSQKEWQTQNGCLFKISGPIFFLITILPTLEPYQCNSITDKPFVL